MITSSRNFLEEPPRGGYKVLEGRRFVFMIMFASRRFSTQSDSNPRWRRMKNRWKIALLMLNVNFMINECIRVHSYVYIRVDARKIVETVGDFKNNFIKSNDHGFFHLSDDFGTPCDGNLPTEIHKILHTWYYCRQHCVFSRRCHEKRKQQCSLRFLKLFV